MNDDENQCEDASFHASTSVDYAREKKYKYIFFKYFVYDNRETEEVRSRKPTRKKTRIFLTVVLRIRDDDDFFRFSRRGVLCTSTQTFLKILFFFLLLQEYGGDNFRPENSPRRYAPNRKDKMTAKVVPNAAQREMIFLLPVSNDCHLRDRWKMRNAGGLLKFFFGG